MATAVAKEIPDTRGRTLSAGQARRIALAAQGFATPGWQATPRSLSRLLQQLGAIQIDSINVLARSHELVLAVRTGSDARQAFERLIYKQRQGFEYWGHAASFLPIEAYRLFLPRMAMYASGKGRAWFARAREAYVDIYRAVLERISAEGPLTASAFRDQAAVRRGSWWQWTPAKVALEDLHAQGVLLVHDRVNFERRYDLAERVLPSGLDLREPTPHEAAMELVLLAARALGVGTFRDLQDYFRLPLNQARPAVKELVVSRQLEPVGVEGWAEPGYVLPDVRVPRKTDFPPAMLSPFDSLVWATSAGGGARERTRRLFDFDYKLEIYLPREQRNHGDYTMPVLAGGRLIARVDPKLDRKEGRLILRAVHLESSLDTDAAVDAIASASWRLAATLSAQEVALEGSAAEGFRVLGDFVPRTGERLRAALAGKASGPASS